MGQHAPSECALQPGLTRSMTSRPLGDSMRARVAPMPTKPSAGLSHAPAVVPGAAEAVAEAEAEAEAAEEEEEGSDEGGEEKDGRCCDRGLCGGG